MFNWLGRSAFQYVHRNYLVYGGCWEDPQVDRHAMRIGANDQLLVITSAGCNVLDYLLAEPSRIDAVDLNYRQNALLDLKLAAIRELDWPEFFAIFGTGRDPDIRQRYRSRLRARLADEHRWFWDRHIRIFCGRLPFYHRTSSGWLASWFRWYIDNVLRLKVPIQELLNARSISEQREIYDAKLRKQFWRPSLSFFLQRDSILALTGIPPEQRRQLQRYHPSLLSYLQSRAEQVIYNLPISENYFWRGYLTGQFTPQCCPRYLKQENFKRLKKLIERVSFHTNSVQGFLESTNQTYSHYVLLDHMDWLANQKFTELESEWQAILDHARPGATCLWRSLGSETPFVDRVRVQYQGKQHTLGELIHYDLELAQCLLKEERANAYGMFAIATLPS